MCSRRSALIQEGLAEFERLHVWDAVLKPGSRHYWFVFSAGGKTLRIPCSGSPSDRHAGKSLCRTIRRVVFKAREDAKKARQVAKVAGHGAKAATGQRTQARELVKA